MTSLNNPFANDQSMLESVDMQGYGQQGGEDGDKVPQGACGQQNAQPPCKPLKLLLQATQVNGRPLPIGSFTACTVTKIVQHYSGEHPVDVKVVTDHEAILDFEPPVCVGG